MFGIKIDEDYDTQRFLETCTPNEIQEMNSVSELLVTSDLHTMDEDMFTGIMEMYGFSQEKRKFIVNMLYQSIIKENEEFDLKF